MRSVKYFLFLIALVGFLINARSQDIPPTTSLVFPGTDGKLVYVADSLGNKIADFSYAGFKGGGVPIPYAAIKETVWPVLGDNSENIQAAIDRVSALPLDANGFRGAVLLKMGIYNLDKPININASGVILRGEGTSDVGTILVGKLERVAEDSRGASLERQGFGRRSALVNITGESGISIQEDTKQVITDAYVPVGSHSFNVQSANGFKAGDKIIVRRIGNEDFIKEIGLDEASAGRNRWRPFNTDYDRVITKIEGNTITLDAPVFCAIDKRWGGGEIYTYEDEGRLENVGVENLRGISEYDPSVRMTSYGNMDRGNWDATDRPHYEGDEYYADENHYFTFISLTNTINSWVRNISALHFGSSVVSASRGTKWITIQDCESREPVSIRAGARRFTFQLSGQLSFVQRCYSQKGRHSFVNGTGASGNVFMDCVAENPFSTSEPHANWITGALYDNVKAPLSARFWKDIGMGWTAANNVFWNCEGDYLIQSPPTAENYSFGHIGVNAVIFNTFFQDLTKPNGHVESMDKHVTPKSLYLTQLKERLGSEAVKNTFLNTDNSK
ncbi:MAG: hypothetical protein JXR61_10075 [Prolixibacteraceae bacterium]|nr:hypothetical protein [Prolixibacteraceae bacterium]